MNNGYGCIWTRVRVLSVLTAGDPGLVRVRLASTSHQRRPGVLPASVPPRPPRRAQRSSSGESLDSGVRRTSRRRRGGARTPRAVSSKIQADLGSYERVYDVCVCPRAAAAPAMWWWRAGRGAVSSVQLYLVTSGSSVMKRSSAVIATVTTATSTFVQCRGTAEIESSDFSVRGSVSSDGAAVTRPPHVTRAATHAWNSLVSEEWTQSPGKC